jgi:hypothetical protein
MLRFPCALGLAHLINGISERNGAPLRMRYLFHYVSGNSNALLASALPKSHGSEAYHIYEFALLDQFPKLPQFQSQLPSHKLSLNSWMLGSKECRQNRQYPSAKSIFIYGHYDSSQASFSAMDRQYKKI